MRKFAKIAACGSIWAGLLTIAQGAAVSASKAIAAALPGDSVLQLSGDFTDQSGRHFRLVERRGAPQLIAMFYGSCQSVCPMLIETSIAVEKALEPALRPRLRVLLVSFDPRRDTPAKLLQTARDHRLDVARWTLARTDEHTVSRLAAVLDIRYRRLETGDFNHTSALILLDAQGRMLARTELLSKTPEPQFVRALRTSLQQP
jgi:protein SCO1/2